MTFYFGNLDPSNDVDFYRIDLSAGQTVTLDIDDGFDAEDGDTLDTVVSLFDQGGHLVAFNDDSFPPDPGSTSGLDSYLTYTAAQDGPYFAAVTSFPNFFDTFSGDWRNVGGSTGDYLLAMT